MGTVCARNAARRNEARLVWGSEAPASPESMLAGQCDTKGHRDQVRDAPVGLWPGARGQDPSVRRREVGRPRYKQIS